MINVGSGVGRWLNQVVDAPSDQISRPIQLMYAAAHNFDVQVSVLDIALAKAELGWTPCTSFAQGLR